MRRAAMFVALAGVASAGGCGRSGFVPLDDSAVGPDTDGNGGGLDDANGDGNGQGTGDALDDASSATADASDPPTRVACSSTNRRVTTQGSAGASTVVWTGSEYGLAWVAGSDTWFRRLDITGAPIGGEVKVSGSNPAGRKPGLVWNGTDYVVAWVEGQNQRLRMIHVDAAGAPIGNSVPISPQATQVLRSFSFVYSGTEYAVAWHADATIAIGRRDSAGGTVGTDSSFTSAFSGDMTPQLSWNGTTYALAYGVNGVGSCPDSSWRIEHRLVDAGGVMSAPRTVDSWNRFGFSTCNQDAFVQLAATSGGMYGVSWPRTDGQGGAGTFVTLDASGVKQSANVPIGPSTVNAALAAGSATFGLAWIDYAANPNPIVFARRDGTGTLLGTELVMTDAAAVTPTLPTVYWNGTDYLVLWRDMRDGTGGEIYTAIGCP